MARHDIELAAIFRRYLKDQTEYAELDGDHLVIDGSVRLADEHEIQAVEEALGG